MESLPEVWEQVEYIAGILKEVVKPEHTLRPQDLTDIRDDLNACAEAVQTIRDTTFK